MAIPGTTFMRHNSAFGYSLLPRRLISFQKDTELSGIFILKSITVLNLRGRTWVYVEGSVREITWRPFG